MNIKNKCNLTDIEHYAFLGLRINSERSIVEIVGFPLTAKILLIGGAFYGVRSETYSLTFVCLIGLAAQSVYAAYQQAHYRKIYGKMATKIEEYINRV